MRQQAIVLTSERYANMSKPLESLRGSKSLGFSDAMGRKTSRNDVFWTDKKKTAQSTKCNTHLDGFIQTRPPPIQQLLCYRVQIDAGHYCL
jgi:hypothetical protein